MDYDVVIIGAGLSGLAAGIRLAHFNKKVCILERHALVGGLNSYYRKYGRYFDVGLHAMTNFSDPRQKNAPLNKLLRQLRLKRDDFDLCPQRFSTVKFPNVELRFTNDIADLEAEVDRLFPDQINGFRRLVQVIRDYDALSLYAQARSTRTVLERYITSPLLQDMILCPLMYYGNAAEHDMDFNQFCIMFQSIFLEGFCRPRRGIRQLLDVLLTRYQDCGGELRRNCGVRKIKTTSGILDSLLLDDGSAIRAKAVLSSAGYVETLQLCNPPLPSAQTHPRGQLAFVESIFVLDRPPADLGLKTSITFFNNADRFRYTRAKDLANSCSGVLCAPTNFQIPAGDMPENQLRITHLADYAQWGLLKPEAYQEAKENILSAQRETLEAFVPGVKDCIVCTDMFTPKTITRYTGHLNGAVYGSPQKQRDGLTPVKNLFICGTDQGFLGIIGAMLSGVSMANFHLLK